MQVKKERVTKVLTHSIHQDQLEVCMKDWAELADEYRDLELRHKEYREVLYICNTHTRKGKINEISCADLGEMHGPTEEVYQRRHTSGPSGLQLFLNQFPIIFFQKYRLGVIKKLAREIEVNPKKKEEAGEVEDLQKDLMRRSAQLDQMQEVAFLS